MSDPVVDGDGILDDGIQVVPAGMSDLGVAIPKLPSFSIDGNGVVSFPGRGLLGEVEPVGFGKLVHPDIELFQKGEVGGVSVLVAIDFSCNPGDGRLFEKQVNGINKIKTVCTRFRNKTRLAYSDGCIIITGNNTLSTSDVVGLGKGLNNNKNSIQASQFTSVGVTILERTRNSVDTLNVGLTIRSDKNKTRGTKLEFVGAITDSGSCAILDCIHNILNGAMDLDALNCPMC